MLSNVLSGRLLYQRRALHSWMKLDERQSSTIKTDRRMKLPVRNYGIHCWTSTPDNKLHEIIDKASMFRQKFPLRERDLVLPWNTSNVMINATTKSFQLVRICPKYSGIVSTQRNVRWNFIFLLTSAVQSTDNCCLILDVGATAEWSLKCVRHRRTMTASLYLIRSETLNQCNWSWRRFDRLRSCLWLGDHCCIQQCQLWTSAIRWEHQ